MFGFCKNFGKNDIFFIYNYPNKAPDKITSKNPTASTKDRAIILEIKKKEKYPF